MSSAIETGLLPFTSEIRPEGLAVGGALLTELAQRWGTPLFVYDEEHLRRHCREAVVAFVRDNVPYASKAFLCSAMARLAHEEGLLLDVASGGELRVALHAGVPARRIVLHGKDKAELRTAMSAGVRHVVVDSFDEMDRIERLHAEERLPPARVQLRVAPGVAAGAHEAIRTGGNDSKFGFGLVGGTAVAAVRRAAGSPAMILDRLDHLPRPGPAVPAGAGQALHHHLQFRAQRGPGPHRAQGPRHDPGAQPGPDRQEPAGVRGVLRRVPRRLRVADAGRRLRRLSPLPRPGRSGGVLHPLGGGSRRPAAARQHLPLRTHPHPHRPVPHRRRPPQPGRGPGRVRAVDARRPMPRPSSIPRPSGGPPPRTWSGTR
ncbi:hypothetical protein PUR32_15680 [Streptomyces sp. BE133]|nr:hypothetical protein [Streptomyces sp. BE133]